MQLILTHEQADFDALASLYAASLLEGALPVLPRRANRNARAFLTLFGLDFPFIDPRDLPQEAIDTVTLVDTQSLITLKGMGKDTKVTVYDHHARGNQPKNAPVKNAEWKVVTFELGATTTYFVEILRERGDVLTTIQASLLLLGIYEDTGSLTFSHTTARDVHAAGWLLEQGADLRIVTNFLNPPLSQEQRVVYDQLVAGIETIDINGHRIMLACGEAGDATEEISTIAHKLRDLFDPDALFVFVQTSEGIRFVARSSTDQIDVAVITAHFGGGGHNRAAAALIKKPAAGQANQNTIDGSQPGTQLEAIRYELLAMLPDHIRPMVTVAQLMSKRPRVLSGETPVQEAAKLMARYGYEGFPVLNDGKVVGLLTRRAVDRAISHHLNLSVSSLMEAGTVAVHLNDSIQYLQKVMMESGWGQVPVVDVDTHKVIGIVTRTDVLKMLSRRHPHSAQYQSLAGKLAKLLSPERERLIRTVAEEAASLHLPVYVVGGFVRDLLLDQPGMDLDVVVEGDAISLGNDLVSKFGGKLTTHTRFGTAKWYLDGSNFANANLPPFLDLISARQEFYEHPSALPTVEHSSIKLDLHRRDFTINTLAMRLDGRHFGELHDYYGGFADIERRYVRVLHSLSFIDDPTRMLRAVRYEQRYGFEIEARTLQLMAEARPLIARLSEERVRHELDLILREKKVVAVLARLEDLGLLKAISADLPWNVEISSRLETGIRSSVPNGWSLINSADGHPPLGTLLYSLWFLDLSSGAIEVLQTRLGFSVAVLEVIREAASLYADLAAFSGAKPSGWVDRLDGVPLLSVYAVYLASGEAALEKYATLWRNIHPKTTGETLMARGLAPGPSFRSLLTTLRKAWLDGKLASEADEAAYLDELLK